MNVYLETIAMQMQDAWTLWEVTLVLVIQDMMVVDSLVVVSITSK